MISGLYGKFEERHFPAPDNSRDFTAGIMNH